MKDTIKEKLEGIDFDELREATEEGEEQVTEWSAIIRDLLVAYRVPLSILGGFAFVSLAIFRVWTGGWPGFFGTIWSVIAALFGYAIYVVPIGGGLGALLYYFVGDDNNTRAADIHPLYGRGKHAFADMRFGEEIWTDLDVVLPSGEEGTKDHLNKIEFVKSRDSETGKVTAVEEGYELMGYDPITNTATATYLGHSSLEMRRYEEMLRRIDTELQTMADWGIESLLDQPLVARMIATRVTQYLVECHSKATMPNGDELTGIARGVLDDLGQEQIESLEAKLDNDMPDDVPDPRDPGHSFEYAQGESQQ